MFRNCYELNPEAELAVKRFENKDPGDFLIQSSIRDNPDASDNESQIKDMLAAIFLSRLARSHASLLNSFQQLIDIKDHHIAHFRKEIKHLRKQNADLCDKLAEKASDCDANSEKNQITNGWPKTGSMERECYPLNPGVEQAIRHFEDKDSKNYLMQIENGINLKEDDVKDMLAGIILSDCVREQERHIAAMQARIDIQAGWGKEKLRQIFNLEVERSKLEVFVEEQAEILKNQAETIVKLNGQNLALVDEPDAAFKERLDIQALGAQCVNQLESLQKVTQTIANELVIVTDKLAKICIQ